MGDRYYMQQKAAGLDKPGRELKKHVIADIETMLGKQLASLTKMTMVDLRELRCEISKNITAGLLNSGQSIKKS
jgi:hypothetical protein